MDEKVRRLILKLLHDINNIICACSGYTEILIMEEDRPRQKEILENLLRCIIRLSKLIEKTHEVFDKDDF